MALIYDNIETKFAEGLQGDYYQCGSKACGFLRRLFQQLAIHYVFTEEELDFIINYDIKYRMGDELNEE